MPPENLQQIISSIEALGSMVPLDMFVFLGMFTDEIFPPIPALFLLIVAGTIAKAKEQTIIFLMYLALVGAIGRTLGAWILYVIGDKAESLFTGRFGKLLGVTHKEIERIGQKLTKGRKDDIFLFVSRAIPVVPTTPISLICGILKTDMKTYLTMTFGGVFVRNLISLYLGYAGILHYEKIFGRVGTAELVVNILLILSLILAWIFYKRKKFLV